MSEDLILIRMQLAGAREVATEAEVASGAIRGTGAAATEAGVASKASTTSVSKFSSGLSKLAKVGKLAGLGLAAGVVGLAAVTKTAVESTGELAKATIGLNQNLGIGVKQASEWAAAAKARGVDTKALSQAMGTLAKNQDLATHGGATQEKLFKRLGVSSKELADGSKDVGGLVTNVADGLDKLGPGTDRTRIAMSLFGKGWQTLTPLIRDGGGALQDQLDLAEKYHVTFTGKTLSDQTDFIAAQRESKLAWMGIQQSLSSAVLPTLTKAEGVFQDFAAELTDPNLTTNEKLTLIADKVKSGFNTAFRFVVKLIPGFASKIGQKVPAVAGAFVQGFLQADIWGKLLLGAWLVKILAGSAIKAAVGSAAVTLAGAFAKRFIATAAVWFLGGSLVGKLAQLSPAMSTIGSSLGGAFGRAFAAGAITLGLTQVDQWLTDHFDVGGSGIIPGVSGNPISDFIGGLATGGTTTRAGTVLVGERGPELLRLPAASQVIPLTAMSGGTRTIHTHVHLDGRVVAESVARWSEGRRARR